MYLNSPYETKTETESAFAQGWVKQFGNIKFLIMSIGTVVFFTLLLVTGNTMAISVRERTNELGVLKAIGFPDRVVLGFILGESMAIALAGCVGLLLALVAIPALSRAMAGLLPPLLVTAKTLVYGVIAALVVGFASGILPAYGAMRMRVDNCPSEGLSMMPKLIFGVVITAGGRRRLAADFGHRGRDRCRIAGAADRISADLL